MNGSSANKEIAKDIDASQGSVKIDKVWGIPTGYADSTIAKCAVQTPANRRFHTAPATSSTSSPETR